MTRRKRRIDRMKLNIAKIEHDLAVARCIRELIGPDKRGNPKKKWVNMTPTRYGHAVELLRAGKYTPGVVVHATNIINASAWLKKPVARVTDEEVSRLLRDKPWEAQQGDDNAEGNESQNHNGSAGPGCESGRVAQYNGYVPHPR